jgi:hypothetical protein
LAEPKNRNPIGVIPALVAGIQPSTNAGAR